MRRRTAAIFVLVFVLLATGIVAVGYRYYGSQERAFKLQVERRLEAVADLKVHELLLWRRERLADARIFRNPAFAALVRRYLQNPADQTARSEIVDWMSGVEADRDYDLVRLLDSRGHVRIQLPKTAFPPSTATTREVLEVMHSGQVRFLDFYRKPATDTIQLAVLTPVIDPVSGRRPIGVIMFRVDPSKYLYPFIQHWPEPSRTAETLLVRREGSQVVFLNELRHRKNTALSLRIGLKRTDVPAVKGALGHRGALAGTDYRGTRVMAAVGRIPGSPWYLVAKVDSSEVFAPLRERLWITVALVGLMLICAAAGVGLVWRKQSVEALRASEENYRAIFDAANDAILVHDAKTGAILDVNRKMSEMFGYAPEEAKLIDIADLSAGEPQYTSTDALQWIGRAIAGGPQLFEWMAKDKSGRVFWVEVNLKHASVGGQDRLLAIVRDITERKRVEEALRESHEHATGIIESITDGFLALDREWRYTYVNSESERLLHKTREELMGNTVWDVFPETLRSRFHDEFLRATAEQVTVEFEEYYPPLGAWLSVRAYPSAEGLSVYLRDITERKRTEEALRESEERLQLKLNAVLSPDVDIGDQELGSILDVPALQSVAEALTAATGVVTAILDVKGKILVAAGWQDICTQFHRVHPETALNCTESDLRLAQNLQPGQYAAYKCKNNLWDVATPLFIGEKHVGNVYIGQFFYDDEPVDVQSFADQADRYGFDKEAYLSALQRVPRFSHEKVNSLMEIMVKFSEMVSTLSYSNLKLAKALADQEQTAQELTRYREHLEDLVNERTAELAVAKERAEESDQLKSIFLSTMSHELRTPLNSIIGFTGILLQGMAGALNDEQAKQLGMVRGSARHLLDLINDVLDLSKIEAGQIEIACGLFDLRSAISKVMQTVMPQAEEKGLTLVEKVAPEVNAVWSDQRRVEQVLLNLINNAVKFTDAGEVRVECELRDGQVVMRVIDTGIGIKREDMGMLFKPFQQVDNGTGRVQGGTGLGLSICKRLAQMLGGDIWAESEWGVGSTFVFTLPAAHGERA